MGNPESSILIPEPKDEFRKTRLGMMSDRMNQDIGFTSFRLAQKIDTSGKKLGRASYSVNLENKTGNEKQDELLIYLTQYLSDIELGPVEIDKDGRFIFDKDVNADKRDKIYEKITNPCILFFNKIEDRFKEFKDIQYFSIDKGVLSLGVIIPPHKGTQVLNINLSSVFTKDKNGEFVFNDKKMDQELRGKTRQSIDSLRQSLETESFFDGGLIVSYETKELAKQTIGTTLQVAGAIGSINTLEYSVRRMMFRDEAGRMQEVDPKIIRSVIGTIGDKTRINQLLLKIMQKSGRVFNSIRGAFTDINTLGIDKATDRIKNLKKTDFLETKNMTDSEFEQAKGEIAQEIARTPRSMVVQKAGEFLKGSNTFAKGIFGKSVGYMFWGVFFQEYQKNTYDITNMYKGVADTGLFFTGANLGSRVAPGIWKMPVGLIGGGLAVLGGNMAGGAMGLDKKMWRMMPDRVTGNGEKSVAGHIIFGGATNDAADKINTDLGIPGTRGGAVVYNPRGKDGIMPNVDFARTNIDFGVNPREYLSSRIGGTDTHWNTRMDQYVNWSTHEIMKVLLDFKENRGFFSESNTRNVPGTTLEQKKKTLLAERIRPILDSEDGKNKRNTIIIDDCIEYISNKMTKVGNLAEQKELLSIFLGNYANVLKIDADSLTYEESLLDRDKIILDGQIQMYLSLLSPEKRQFAEKIFVRLQKGDTLVNGKIVRHASDVIGPDIEIFKADKKELALYHSLFNDETSIKDEWYNLLGYTEPNLDYKNASFSLPDKVISLGGKKVYFRSYFEIIFSEYKIAASSKKGDIISTIDTKYGLNILQSMKDKKGVLTDFEFRGILLENILKDSPDARQLILEKNKKLLPTQGDIFVYLLNLQTEYREQKRYIDTQKNIGYATKWKF